ncbi:MAG: acetyl-CoA hydrolase/transferase C-terminal domain-containing protein [Bryobacteraceae bacterium]
MHFSSRRTSATAFSALSIGGIVEAAEVLAGGGIVLTSSVGATPTYLNQAEKILIEINTRHPPALLGMHDIFEPHPPTRQTLPIFHPSGLRRLSHLLRRCPQIAGIVYTNQPDENGAFSPPTPVTERIGQNVADFLVEEIRSGRIPETFLPLQSGVGDIANSVLAALGQHPDIPDFEMYTEVLQDSVVPLLENGRVKFASTCAFTLSDDMMRRVYSNLDFYRHRVLMRPQEITNHPEIVRRLGIVSMNTAIEIDVGGNVNSTHVMGQTMMNGIGGSGDFTRNAYLSFFSCPSTQKGGKISTIVPLVSHMDHSEHSVQVVATEWGVADLRGKDPHQRAHLIIEKCAHPDYREPLRAYLAGARKGHEPFSAQHAFAMHLKFLREGDMRGVTF